MFQKFEFNAGSGMALGVAVAAMVALLVNLATGDGSVWSWAIPVGLACGLAIGAGRASQRKEEKS